MIDKCANTACTERMVYLRSGVLYEVDILITSDAAHATHFFWLCMSCSEKYDLRFSERGDPSLVPLDTPSAHDESTSDHRRIRRIFINQPPPVSTEAIVDYADLERETPYPIEPMCPCARTPKSLEDRTRDIDPKECGTVQKTRAKLQSRSA